jgi:hypothetical protein
VADHAANGRLEHDKSQAIAVMEWNGERAGWNRDGGQHLGQEPGWQQSAAHQCPQTTGQILEAGHQCTGRPRVRGILEGDVHQLAACHVRPRAEGHAVAARHRARDARSVDREDAVARPKGAEDAPVKLLTEPVAGGRLHGQALDRPRRLATTGVATRRRSW